ncbi:MULTISPECIES: hypothetical protein [unclassified Aurantimonas]|uniref:hypothetical protein n=1 Tax=unclassified Aurantimonas TaxID=2638230 RepID=UPI002E176E74|nr:MULTISPECIES: hypothetical protein [unclassified Aurantimonas]MEC5291592.1 hypothetical protein [Aurantimonas sp. C2-3-R2]MEC5412676.1 hypothetical protein [Aurantimonas sp. C2-4-R8]
MRDRDVAEFMAVSRAETRDDLTDMLAQSYGRRADAMCASQSGIPIGVGAMVEVRPNVATLLFFANHLFPQIVIGLTGFIRGNLFPRYREAGFHRIECVSMDGYGQAHRWIEILGLTREAVMPGYGRNGETFHQFAWVDLKANNAYPESAGYCGPRAATPPDQHITVGVRHELA